MTQKFAKILKSVTNNNFASSTYLNFENFVWMVLLFTVELSLDHYP